MATSPEKNLYDRFFPGKYTCHLKVSLDNVSGHLTLKQDLPNSIASSDTERKLKMHMA